MRFSLRQVLWVFVVLSAMLAVARFGGLVPTMIVIAAAVTSGVAAGFAVTRDPLERRTSILAGVMFPVSIGLVFLLSVRPVDAPLGTNDRDIGSAVLFSCGLLPITACVGAALGAKVRRRP